MGINRRRFIKYLGATSIVGMGATNISQAWSMPSRYSWHPGPELATPIQEIYPAVFGGEIFVGGGFVPSANSVFYGLAPSKQVHIYNPQSKAWRTGPVLPEARHHLGMVSNSQYLYGVGGFYGVEGNGWQIQDKVYRLSAQSNEWVSGPDLPAPMAESTYAAIGENIHVVGGKSIDPDSKKTVDVASHFVLVDNDKWETAAPASVARNSAACTVLNGKLFVIGGRKAGKHAENLGFGEMYDQKTDKWERIAPFPAALAGLAASPLDGKIIVTGGEAFGPNGNWKTGSASKQVWAYDPKMDAWEKHNDMPEARHGHGSVTLNESMYIIGGGAKVGPQETSASMLVLSK